MLSDCDGCSWKTWTPLKALWLPGALTPRPLADKQVSLGAARAGACFARARARSGAFREQMSACKRARRRLGSEQPMLRSCLPCWGKPARCQPEEPRDGAGHGLGSPGSAGASPAEPGASRPSRGWPAPRCSANAWLPVPGALLEFFTGKTWEMCVLKITVPFRQVKLLARVNLRFHLVREYFCSWQSLEIT